MDGAKAWCYFRNLTHTVYREARHVGTVSDREAKFRISQGPLLAAAGRCSQNRARLKSQALFGATKNAKTTDEVIRPYLELTSLTPIHLMSWFNSKGWQAGYGGTRWAKITELLIKLT
jgi:hypothetical protein